MDTAKLKQFAQDARRTLLEQVTAKLQLVLETQSAARRENPQAITELEKAIASSSQQQLIDKVAYTWFNRFCALRFMDINGYNQIASISPAEGQSQPEILAEAKQGLMEETIVKAKTQQTITQLLNGQAPSNDPQTEAYRLLLVAVCNYYHKMMPFLFEKIADYTELLMPDDLLSANSILADTRKALTPEACEDVEVIGWLYQFYISEKKDEVFAGLKKNKKVTPENIPAATQLFTPHWIVRYLVENSLGRLWMLNHPDSKLAKQMEYYIPPEQPETDFLTITSPEELKICDPACGSGHMLTYAFDLLYSIYEEQGYASNDIPTLILKNNLYGIEIDQRAGELAAFALTMKARSKYRRFFRKVTEQNSQPNICVLQNIKIEEQALDEYSDFVGHDLINPELRETLAAFEEADNFGSLIRPTLTDIDSLQEQLEAKDVSGQMFLNTSHKKVLQVLKQADYLSQKYQVVIANPPYMGGKGMNDRLKKWAADNYKASKSDLFAMFIERNLDLAVNQGLSAMITMQSWMFLSSFQNLRTKLLEQDTILSMAHLGTKAFDSIGGEVVSTTAFVLKNENYYEYKGNYFRLIEGKSEADKKEALLEAIKNLDCAWLYSASISDFKKIPGSPIAYWVSKELISIFSIAKSFDDIGKTRRGLQTGNSEKFIRKWFEVSCDNLGLAVNKEQAQKSKLKWFLFNSGGTFRKWYGNIEDVVNWKNDGDDIKLTGKAIIPSEYLYFQEAITWPKVSTGRCSFRWFPNGIIPGDAGPCFYDNSGFLNSVLCFSNSKVSLSFLQFLSPTLNFEVGVMAKMPILSLDETVATNLASKAIRNHEKDWNSYESSLGFTLLPLVKLGKHEVKLKDIYRILSAERGKAIKNTQEIEEENNRIYIKAYGLQNELTPEVPLNEITLTCNPHYRYSGNKTEEELDALLLADTMREFISYAVGCMFGRYSLDKDGLILASQGETLEDYFTKINSTEQTDSSLKTPNAFPPDEDNVIPVLDGDWFTDDIADRFREFLRVTFGDEHYQENLKFIEEAIGKDIRKFFIRDFYKDHLKRYKKRPIYWLFSSPKGSFNALIYMHRYQPDTVSVILNDYLREFRTKLEANKNNLDQISISGTASAGEKTKAIKEIEKLRKVIDELNEYEHDILYPLATQKLTIDLDDGVKVNYNKFGLALKKETGLTEK